MKSYSLAQKGISEYLQVLREVEKKVTQQSPFLEQAKELKGLLVQEEQHLETLDQKCDALLNKNLAPDYLKIEEILRKNLMRELAEEKKNYKSQLVFRELIKQKLGNQGISPESNASQSVDQSRSRSFFNNSDRDVLGSNEGLNLSRPEAYLRKLEEQKFEEDNNFKQITADDIKFGITD
mmetsp:Transcript_1094/g.1104  ORF Transcript_1094/g.1104 Transcript_1094/m.1104 type:complete len:180 (+) Transcript_1094:187-726(+)